MANRITSLVNSMRKACDFFQFACGKGLRNCHISSPQVMEEKRGAVESCRLHPKNTAEFIVEFFGPMTLTAASEESVGAG